MYKVKTENYKLFWKSFIVTALILGCIIALIIGVMSGHSLMESERTGKDVRIIEITEEAVKILGNEIYDRKNKP